MIADTKRERKRAYAQAYRHEHREVLAAKYRARTSSPEGTLRRIYHNQRSHSVKRGHALPTYTLQQFLDRWLDDSAFLELHLRWFVGGMQRADRPSFDRKDDQIGYSFENIELKTWRENDARGLESRLKARRVPVIVIEPGGAVRRFASHAEARESLGISTRHHGRSVVNSGRPTKGCYVYTAEFYNEHFAEEKSA